MSGPWVTRTMGRGHGLERAFRQAQGHELVEGREDRLLRGVQTCGEVEAFGPVPQGGLPATEAGGVAVSEGTSASSVSESGVAESGSESVPGVLVLFSLRRRLASLAAFFARSRFRFSKL